jgi:hypothetical protein
VTEWLAAGDARNTSDTIIAVLAGTQDIGSAMQRTKISNHSFIASAKSLEDLGRQMKEEPPSGSSP